jgi:soluble lytic murein transglycosylase
MDGDDRLAIAVLYARAGAPGAAHGVLRDGGMALLPGTPAGDDLLSWTLDYPRAHEAAIVAAARSQSVPSPLLFGLAREESAFDASIVSWAGAVGLCQLMPPTAKEEAASLKLTPPTIAALRDPALNAQLGAAHLGRRLRGMSHPLLAIAAYNAGPGGVQKWLDVPNRMTPLDAFIETIPVDETRGYVKKVTGSWIAYALLDEGEPVRFALEIP